MQTYFISETTHQNAFSEATAIQAKDLSQAKRKASLSQFFQGTVMSIGIMVDENGFILEPISQKIDGKWQDTIY